MKLTWLGHAGYRMEIAGQIFLVDPWFEGNPAYDPAQRETILDGVTHILVTHAHMDHAVDALAIAKAQDITLVGIYDLMAYWEAKHGIKTIGYNKGGTIALGDVAVTMVNATHSSSFDDNGLTYGGHESGFMIAGEGKVIYFSGDTDVMADMAILEDLHHPDIGILSAGGHFTMDMDRAAYAAKKFFNFKTIIPNHYKTLDFLAQSAQPLIDGVPGANVIEPVAYKPFEL